MGSLGRSVTLALPFAVGWDVAAVVVGHDARPRVFNPVAADLTWGVAYALGNALGDRLAGRGVQEAPGGGSHSQRHQSRRGYRPRGGDEAKRGAIADPPPTGRQEQGGLRDRRGDNDNGGDDDGGGGGGLGGGGSISHSRRLRRPAAAASATSRAGPYTVAVEYAGREGGPAGARDGSGGRASPRGGGAGVSTGCAPADGVQASATSAAAAGLIPRAPRPSSQKGRYVRAPPLPLPWTAPPYGGKPHAGRGVPAAAAVRDAPPPVVGVGPHVHCAW